MLSAFLILRVVSAHLSICEEFQPIGYFNFDAARRQGRSGGIEFACHGAFFRLIVTLKPIEF